MSVERRITVDSLGEAEIRPTQVDAVIIGGLIFAASTAPEDILAQANYYVEASGAIISTHTCEVVSIIQPRIQPDTL